VRVFVLFMCNKSVTLLCARVCVHSYKLYAIIYFVQVEACRARLYRLAKKDPNSETPETSHEWRESCKRAIIPSVSYVTSNSRDRKGVGVA